MGFRYVNVRNTEISFFSVFEKMLLGPTDAYVTFWEPGDGISSPWKLLFPKVPVALWVATWPCTELYKLGIVFSLGFINKWKTMVDETSRERTGTFTKESFLGEEIVIKQL